MRCVEFPEEGEPLLEPVTGLFQPSLTEVDQPDVVQRQRFSQPVIQFAAYGERSLVTAGSVRQTVGLCIRHAETFQYLGLRGTVAQPPGGAQADPAHGQPLVEGVEEHMDAPQYGGQLPRRPVLPGFLGRAGGCQQVGAFQFVPVQCLVVARERQWGDGGFHRVEWDVGLMRVDPGLSGVGGVQMPVEYAPQSRRTPLGRLLRWAWSVA